MLCGRPRGFSVRRLRPPPPRLPTASPQCALASSLPGCSHLPSSGADPRSQLVRSRTKAL